MEAGRNDKLTQIPAAVQRQVRGSTKQPLGTPTEEMCFLRAMHNIVEEEYLWLIIELQGRSGRHDL